MNAPANVHEFQCQWMEVGLDKYEGERSEKFIKLFCRLIDAEKRWPERRRHDTECRFMDWWRRKGWIIAETEVPADADSVPCITDKDSAAKATGPETHPA